MTQSAPLHSSAGAASRQGSASGRDRLAGWISRDALVTLLLFAAALFYLTRFPLHLGGVDEPKALHEAKRILAGEVMYRDVFDFVLPGWIYLMAGLFKLFGTTLATARITAAVIHALIVVVVYRACRHLVVRRELAAAAALACLVICEPAFRSASYHWLATVLSTLLLLLCLQPRPSGARVLAMGVAVGALIAAHQQRGVYMGLCVGTVVIADAILARYSGAPRARTAWWAQCAVLAAGTLLVIVPLVIELLLRAGFAPVWDSVVVYPLVNYRKHIHAPWGAGGAAESFPRLLALLPVVLLLTAPRLLVRLWQRADVTPTRQLAVLVLFCLFAMLSISYFPDVIHIAFVAPVFFVTIAEAAEWGLSLLSARWQLVVGRTAVLALAVVGMWRLEHNLAAALARPTLPYASGFGRVDIRHVEIEYLDKLAARLRASGSRTLYMHPNAGYMYLLLDARNPTRYEFFLPGFHGAAVSHEIVAALAADPPPYVLTRQALIPRGDPVAHFIEQHYTPTVPGQRIGLVLWSLVPTSPGGASSGER